jgi:glycosyltransferase involved in cell wall biosynthesis
VVPNLRIGEKGPKGSLYQSVPACQKVTCVEVLFWGSLGAIAYAYVGFPALLGAWAGLRPQPRPSGPSFRGPATVVLPVHNEADKIHAKLENLLAQADTLEALEIIVVADGCTDDTVEIVSRLASRAVAVRLLELEGRSGKGAALNAGVALASHEVIVFTDAAIMLEPDALAALVAPLGDTRVGCVSGEDRVAGDGGESAYGRYELWLRRKESAVASIVGASGCLYAQRKDLVPQFEAGVAPDFLSVLHTVARGYRAATRTLAGEFSRKVRTFIRGMAGLQRYRKLLNPLRFGRFALILASHKLLRWSVPLFMVLAIVSNLFLARVHPVYVALLVAQCTLYLVGALALPEASPVGRSRLARLCGYFVTVNAAIALAWLRFLGGKRQEIWQPTVRQVA